MDIALGVSTSTDIRCVDATTSPASDQTAPIVVVGDAVLDQDLVGKVERLSPEAPVPVIDDVVKLSRPGGAGLAAVLAVGRGRPVILVTALSADPIGRELGDLLRRNGITVVDLGLPTPNPVKSRVRVDDRTLLMLSSTLGQWGQVCRPLNAEEQATITTAAALLVSDYGGGISKDPAVRAALDTAVAARVPVVWDPHPRGATPVRGARLITPNTREAAHFAPGIDGSGLHTDIDRGRALLCDLPAEAVAVTRGSAGAILLTAAGTAPIVVPSTPVRGGDTCGAGDCFAAAVTHLLADGYLLSEAVEHAVWDATEYVACGGVSAVLDPSAARSSRKERGSAGSRQEIARIRAAGGTVVATGGCFDLLHSGHISLLEQARQLGDYLVVLLNDDDSVRQLKGPERPVVKATDRAAVLAALSSVDEVVIFTENTPESALSRIRPDIYVKGGDYRLSDIPEADLVKSWGGQTVVLPYLEGRSTTGIIKRIANETRR
ncbi:D-glycero-beta-D-manno-heptose 1-phosphate adenylyltransferase [Streptomyces antimycoticus]